MSERALRLLCVAALALSCATTPQQRLAAGRRAVEAGDSEAAQRELEAGRALELKTPTGALVPLDVELGDLYLTYPELGHEAEVEGLYKEALALAEKGFASDDTKYAGVLQRLGDYYLIEERYADAVPILERFLAASRAHWTVDQTYQSSQASGLAKAYGVVGRRADQAKLRQLIDEPLARKELATQPPAAASAHAAVPPTVAQPRAVAEIAKSQLYLEPNSTDREGRAMFVHFTERDMPLRVSIAAPDSSASDGSAEDTRDSAAQGIREWEAAVRRVLPWFRLAITDDDPNAAVQVVWTRRPRGYSAGFGEIRLDESGPEPRTRAVVTLSTQPLPIPEARQTLGQVYANAVHAFGGALGLGYCWVCDSVRSMAWLERNEFAPTDVDLRTLQALTALPNGKRVEGDPAAREPGVLADLPFLNVGTDRQIFIDLAAPDVSSFVVQLDTGAQSTVVTPVYARALGVAIRRVKEDQNWRDTVMGRPLGFWVSSQVSSGRLEGWNYALLGGEFLRNFVVEIDYRGRHVRFLDPDVAQVGGPSPRPHERVVPMPVDENWPHVQLQLGNGTTLALLDTGDAGSVSISEEAAESLGIHVDPNAPRATWQNVISTSESAMQTIPTLGIGGVYVEHVEIGIGLRGTGVRIERMAGPEVLLGQGVLRRFLVRLDYPRQRLGLTPQ